MIGEVVDPVIHFHNVLSKPTCGLPSIAQAMAVRMGGMKNGRVISTSSLLAQGVSVRAMIQARNTARVSEGIVFAREMPTVFSRISIAGAEKTSA